jgi:integrase
LRDFWRWLHRSDEFGWKRPDGWDELKAEIASLREDDQKLLKAIHIDTWTVDELATLYRHAWPLLKVFILLGLNCGFSIAEFCSLTEGEIYWQEKKIKRIRSKSKVYGEWLLWDETLEVLRWALARKKEIGSSSDVLMVTQQGTPLNTITKGGNRSARIPNLWGKYLSYLQKKVPGFKKLPPKQLRKIGADFIRKVANGEIAALFLAHGSPVKSDPLANDYSNKPFPQLHQALAVVRKQLSPVFDGPCSEPR